MKFFFLAVAPVPIITGSTNWISSLIDSYACKNGPADNSATAMEMLLVPVEVHYQHSRVEECCLSPRETQRNGWLWCDMTPIEIW